MLAPLSVGQWNLTTAAHLLNRAGFGGSPGQIQRLAELGPDAAVSSLLDFERIPDPTPAPDWAKPDPEWAQRIQSMRRAPEEQRRQMQREEQQVQRRRMLELRGWWLQRMAQGPRPFQEKMTLFWHGHFATSVQKVRNAYYMWRQNELFRRLAVGNWLELLVEAARDPAMLVWLDQAQSRKDHPNENFAREVMELFTLGEGHYTETDVTEAARAFTGWSLDRFQEKFVERQRLHDQGFKTVLGRRGNLDGTAVLEQIVAQPQSAVFITGKIWNYFAGQMPAPQLNAGLADILRRSGNNFKPVLRTLFLSQEFYSADLIRNQVKSPVQWLVGSARMLETELPPPFIASNLLRNLGQDLFAPPNVKGWDGGLAWITTNTLLSRYNEATILIQGPPPALVQRLAAEEKQPAWMAQNAPGAFQDRGVAIDKILTGRERTDKEALMESIENRLLQCRLKEKRAQAVREYLDSKPELNRRDILGTIRLVMSTPEYQVA